MQPFLQDLQQLLLSGTTTSLDVAATFFALFKTINFQANQPFFEPAVPAPSSTEQSLM